MDTASRRLALLAWLRAQGTATVPEAAERFGVSVRTVARDLAALREMDEPVEGEPGRGGGIRLNASARLPPVRLAVEEVTGLVLSLAIARQASPMAPFWASAEGALDKLVAALPLERAASLRALLRRVITGRPATPAVAGTVQPVDPGVLVLFERAFTGGRGLTFTYTDRAGNRSLRRVEPHGLLHQPPVWYLLAHDLDREAPRMFRADRIARARMLEISFVPRPVELLEALVPPEVLAPSAPSAEPPANPAQGEPKQDAHREERR